jgi:hypothetical protein
MTGRDHLSRETLVRVFDGELSTAERLEIDVHLSECEQCLDAFDQVAELSNNIAQLMDGMSVAKPRQARERLAEKMTAIAAPQQRDRTSKKLMLWAAAAVALLALVAGLGLHSIDKSPPARTAVLKPVTGQGISKDAGPSLSVKKGVTTPVAGSAELSFIRLPYSNPALPIESEQIVRVNMRLSDLASTGVVKMTPQGSDTWVQADVLLGMDGEPYGIHVLENAPGN